jgi:circadian clock protein KaiC
VHLHEILSYLGQRGIATLIIGAQHGVIGTQMSAPVDASYLADAVILLRYFEAAGEVRQALSIIKKRGGAHERTIREFKLESGHGIAVGEALRGFRGVLTVRAAVRRRRLQGQGQPVTTAIQDRLERRVSAARADG